MESVVDGILKNLYDKPDGSDKTEHKDQAMDGAYAGFETLTAQLVAEEVESGTEKDYSNSIPKAFEVSDLGKAAAHVNENLQEIRAVRTQTVKDILGADFDPLKYRPAKHVSQEFQKFILDENSISQHDIAFDIENFTRLKKDVVCIVDDRIDVSGVENLRVFRYNAFKERGMCYSHSPIELMNMFDYLKNTSIFLGQNQDVYTDRYIYPICLPDGKVYCHMGYNAGPLMVHIKQQASIRVIQGLSEDDNPGDRGKYQIASSPWVNQGNLIANLESLSQYDGHTIICVEGYIDAVRVNEEFKYKSLAMLNSTLTKAKRRILNDLKRRGHYLVYVPDSDEAGMSAIVRDPIWDEIYELPKANLKNISNKDIDSYIKTHYIAKYVMDDEKNLDAVMTKDFNICALVNVSVPFYKESLRTQLYTSSRLMGGGL